ncbi:MAG: hypothetical protein RLZZ69_563, partial [Cyanobacteriota bacterium]
NMDHVVAQALKVYKNLVASADGNLSKQDELQLASV